MLIAIYQRIMAFNKPKSGTFLTVTCGKLFFSFSSNPYVWIVMTMGKERCLLMCDCGSMISLLTVDDRVPD